MNRSASSRTALSRTSLSRTAPSRATFARTSTARAGLLPSGIPTVSPEMLTIAAVIDRYGMHVVHVGEGCDCPDCSQSPVAPEERFGYTIGLTELGHPELLVRGLDGRETATLLNRWGDLVLDGEPLDAGHLLCEGAGGTTWELVPVHRPLRTLRWAGLYYGPSGIDEVSALELIPARRPCPCGSCG